VDSADALRTIVFSHHRPVPHLILNSRLCLQLGNFHLSEAVLAYVGLIALDLSKSSVADGLRNLTNHRFPIFNLIASLKILN